MLEEFGFGESRLFEGRDFGTFKERLRSLAVEEIGQAGEGLPRVGGGWFGPSGSGRFSASGGVHTPKKIAAYIKRARRKYSCLYLFFKEGIRTGHQLTCIIINKLILSKRKAYKPVIYKSDRRIYPQSG